MREYLSYIWSLLAHHKKKIAGLAMLAVGAAILETGAPLLMGRALDSAADTGQARTWQLLIIAWFGAKLSAELIRSYITTVGSTLGDSIGLSQMLSQIGELLHKPIPFHHDQRKSDINTNLIHLRWEITNLLNNTVFDFLPTLLGSIAIITYLAFVHPAIAATLGISSLLLLLFTKSMSRVWDEARGEWHKKSEEATRPGWDALENILIIKSTTNEETILRRLQEAMPAYRTASHRSKNIDLKMYSGQHAIINIGTLAVFFFTLGEVSKGTLTLGTATAITAYAYAIFGYIRWSQWSYRFLLQGNVHYKKMKALLDMESEDYNQGDELTIRGDLEFEQVNFRYLEEKSVLEDVSFKVASGMRVALVGESGQGKTTIVELLGRYYTQKEGVIRVDGIDSRQINLRSLRSQMAYVPQDLSLLHDSIANNIRFGRQEASDEEVTQAARHAHLHTFIEGLPEGYKTVVGERGLKLSGGQRQRVALARAFLRNPKILILDEPTSNLDSKTEQSIQESLRTLMRGKTTLIIAHRLRTVMEADLILVLKDGKIAESGTHDELMGKQSIYREMREAQEQVLSVANA